MEQRTDEWFSARKGKMTCSRMAEAVGMIGSRRRLWRQLTGREQSDFLTPQAAARMQDGVDYEKVALAMYESVTGAHVEPAGFLMHPELDWIGGSPDGLVSSFEYHAGSRGGVEVKCPVEPYGIVPPYYLPQMQGLMEVSNRGWWDFAVWTPETFNVIRVYRSTAYWKQLYELLCEFWTYVEADVEPPVFKRGTKPQITAAVRFWQLHKE